MSTWAYMRVYGRICTCVKRRLCREEYPSEGPALDEVPKCLRSAFERKCPGDDRLDLARLEKPCQRRPGFCPSRCRLREQREAFDAGALPDQVRHIDRRFPARGVAERGEAAARRQDLERVAQDVAADTVHDDVRPVTIREATHAFRQPFRREVDNLGEAQFPRLCGLCVAGRRRDRMLRAQRPGRLGHRVAHRTSDGRRENGIPRLKSRRAQPHKRRQVGDGETRGGVIDVRGNEAQMLLLHRNPFTERSVLRDAVWAREHHARTTRKPLVSAPLDDAGPFVAEHERRFCPWMASRENGVIERSDTGGGHPHQDASIRHRWLGNVRKFQILIAAECLCYNRAHLLILASLTFTLPNAVSPLGSSKSDASSVKANLLERATRSSIMASGHGETCRPDTESERCYP